MKQLLFFIFSIVLVNACAAQTTSRTELSETQTILVPSPIFMYSFDKPALCIDLFMKPELSDELIKYLRGNIKELRDV